MNNYEYNEGIEFNGLMPKVMDTEGIETIGASDFNAKLFENGHLGGGSLEVVDFFGTAFDRNGEGGDDSHEYVDLGLPSGTLWATTNIQDADGNELYFAWGETQGYTAEQVGTVKNFSWDDYKFGMEDNLTKYNNTDKKTELDAEDDAATANWGSNWRMPTIEQFDELTANTTTAFTQVDRVNGFLCTSTANTNTLFFPFVGEASDGLVRITNSQGKYWCSNMYNPLLDHAHAGIKHFTQSPRVAYASLRFIGLSIHPVRKSR